MRHFLLMLGVLLPLTAVGCGQDGANAPRGVAPQANGQLPAGPLFDPLAEDKEVRAMKRPTRWHVSGKDLNGGQWEGYLVIESDPDAYFTSGFFEWARRDTGGRYRFTGTFEQGTRTVRWTGFTIEDRIGNPVNANYQATLSEDGQKLVDGSWQGGVSVPGTWQAEFAGEF